jgi:hypothetical protein
MAVLSRVNQTLSDLSLGDSSIGPAGEIDLAGALTVNRALTSLDLTEDYNGRDLSDTFHWSVHHTALAANSSLISLRGFGGKKHLKLVKRNKRLKQPVICISSLFYTLCQCTQVVKQPVICISSLSYVHSGCEAAGNLYLLASSCLALSVSALRLWWCCCLHKFRETIWQWLGWSSLGDGVWDRKTPLRQAPW